MAAEQSWPGLVGKQAEEAKAEILSKNKDYKVDILPEIAPVTLDYNPERVRIFTKSDGTVAAPPTIG